MDLVAIMSRIIAYNKPLAIFLVGTGASVGIGRAVARALTTTRGRCFSSEDSSASDKRKKSGLYTKTGDGGTSSLYNGERRPKADIVFEVLGHQDELNAVIGIAREHCELTKNGLEDMLKEIQSRLFDLGAAVATPVQTSSSRKKAYTEFPALHTAILEEWIDRIDGTLPPIVNFVIPSGGMSSTHLNLARAVCRRAERSVYALVRAEQVDAEVGRYLNRLSDFLFAATRSAALTEGREELLWRKAVLPSVVATNANAAAAAAAETFFAEATSIGTVTASTPSTAHTDHSADCATDADDDLNLQHTMNNHTTQTPAGLQETFQGFDDDFFDPSVPSSSSTAGITVKKSNSSYDLDDVSVTSRSSLSPKTRPVRTGTLNSTPTSSGSARNVPKINVTVKTPLRGPPGSVSTTPPARKPFSTAMDTYKK